VTRAATFTTLLFLQFAFTLTASAGDFDWLDNIDVKAQADSSGYRFSLASRFKVGDAQVSAVIGAVDRPSDAYMIFRLGELSHRPVARVMEVYRANRRQGWGVMAKRLGIKPGSPEFHALKRGLGPDDGVADDRGPSSGHGSARHFNKRKG